MAAVPGRRSTLLASVLVLAALAGCAAFPYVGPTCGPGETDVGAIGENASLVHVKGELMAFDESAMIVDDGTGQARITIDSSERSQVSTGDCIIARGPAVPVDGEDHDVHLEALELLKEEWVVEE